MRPLLVGEQNPYGSDHEHALYPHPKNSAGGRLCRRIMGLSIAEYLRAFDRTNLCAGEWSAREARESALAIRASRRSGGRVVLLGARVCAAFGVPWTPFQHYWPSGEADNCVTVVLPHPSGRCRAWNEPGAYERARAALTAAGVLPVPPSNDSLADLPDAECSATRPARCANCGGLVEGRDCAECGPP